MKFALGYFIPLVLFTLLSIPAILAVEKTIESLISNYDVRSALENPQEVVSMLITPLLLFYAISLLSFLAFIAGNSFSDARALRSLSAHVLGRENAVKAQDIPLSRKGFYRALMLYSLAWSLASMFLLVLSGIAALIITAVLSSLTPGEGLLLKTMIVLTTVFAFLLGILYLYSARLEGLAFIALEGMRPGKAFIRAVRCLWQEPSSIDLTAGMLFVYGLLQPVMALGAWGLWKVPDAGIGLFFVWGLFWLVLDIYLALSIRATVLVAHCQGLLSGVDGNETLTLEEVAAVFTPVEGIQNSKADVWEYFERKDDKEGEKGDEPAKG